MTRYAISSCHWLATQAAHEMLALGGNIIDAAVTASFVLQVVEPHLNGPGGELVALISVMDSVEPICVSGVGVAPELATIDHFRDLGCEVVPGSGTLSAPVPGQFDALCALLYEHGTKTLAEVLAPAVHLAGSGFPVTASLQQALASALAGPFTHWEDTRRYWLPQGVIPRTGELIKNPSLHDTYQTLANLSAGYPSREQGIRAAQEYWYRGPIAEEIARHVRAPHWHPALGMLPGVLTIDDLAKYSTTLESPLSYTLGDTTIYKPGPWTQGPVLLESFGILSEISLLDAPPDDPEAIHSMVEIIRLAMADRDAYLGDGSQAVPELLAPAYLHERGKLLKAHAAKEVAAGNLADYRPWQPPGNAVAQPLSQSPWAPERIGRGDTCQISIIDHEGQAVSLTASGGWLQSSPVIPTLGFALSTRLQQTWLDPDSPSALTPGKRPRVTLTPTLVMENREVLYSLGTPGGDGQDQWQIHALRRLLKGNNTPDEAVSLFTLQAISFPNSFWPREYVPQGLLIEADAPESLQRDLSRRGHQIFSVPANSLGRLSIVHKDSKTGRLTSAASPRSGYGEAMVV